MGIFFKEMGIGCVPWMWMLVLGVWMIFWCEGNWNGCEKIVFGDIVKMMDGVRTDGGGLESCDAGKVIRWKAGDK